MTTVKRSGFHGSATGGNYVNIVIGGGQAVNKTRFFIGIKFRDAGEAIPV